jgi:hypothetical protein
VYLDELGGTGFGMRFEGALLGPFVGSVVMVDVTKKQAVGFATNDEPDVEADATEAKRLSLGFSSLWNWRLGWAGLS